MYIYIYNKLTDCAFGLVFPAEKPIFTLFFEITKGRHNAANTESFFQFDTGTL